MSTEQQVDPTLVEETKQQIRELVNEIAQLAKSELSPQEFYDEFLNRVVTALAAEGGAIWTTGDSNRIELSYQINFVKTNLANNEEDQARHGKLLGKCLTTCEPMLVAPQSGAGAEEEGANPTEYLLILGPLLADQEIKGVVEIFQRPGAKPTTQRGYLRFLMQMCELAGDYLKTRSLRHFTDRQSLWNQLEGFTREAHRSLDPREAAYTIANEGRRLIGCDRVSVAIQRGTKCKIEAVSGQDTFDSRSNTVRLLGKLATAVVATGETVWYTGDTTDMAPQVEDAIHAYVDEAHCKTIGILPLKREKIQDSDRADEQEPPEVVGALIVEQIEDARLREGMLQRVEVVNDHSSSALANALEHNNLFLMPVWRTIGKATFIVRARTLPKTLAITGAILAVIIAMIVVPYKFRMEGRGELQPVTKREVFSPPDGGVITNVLVEHNDSVKKDDKLLVLKNKDLEIAREEVNRNILTSRKRLDSLLKQINTERDIDKRDQLVGEQEQVLAALDSYDNQLKLIQEKEKMLIIRSPIAGKVLTWDVRNKLINRPVEAGQVLLTIADPGGEWHLEVNMPEGNMGPVNDRRAEVGEEMDVDYVLLTNPSDFLKGTVTEIHQRSNVVGEKGSMVKLHVKIDKEKVLSVLQKNQKPDDESANPELLPGTTVKARVDCGMRSIGYVWLRDLGNWLNREVLFRF